MLEFRKNAEQIIKLSKKGVRMIITYRGRPVMRLEPYDEDVVENDDPFLQLDGIATESNESLDNREMDKIIYEY